MRVIAGSARGRKLKAFKGRDIRPTPDRVREALFNILGTRIAGSRFLDLCAGTGSVGLEALSRGARQVTWVEKERRACRLIAENVRRCGLTAAPHALLQRDALQAISLLEKGGEVFHFIFLDPPFRSPLAERLLCRLAQSPILAPGGLIVAEHSVHGDLQAEYNGLYRIRRRVFGEVVLSFYQRRELLSPGSDDEARSTG